jgi:hypothetical protein
MAKSLASLRSSTAVLPPILGLYGVHGWGKTTLASEFPNPVFIQTENGTPGGVELHSFGEIESFSEVLESIASLLTEPHDYLTCVTDSIDAMEPLIWQQACVDNKWDSIESAGFGKGYIVVDQYWREYLAACRALTLNGIAVVMIAHSDITRFDSPTTDPYSRYGIKLHKRASALVQEAADIVGFCNYRVSIKTEDAGFKKTTRGVGGGQRLIHLEERPGFLAKNRYQMPESVEYRPGKGYEALSLKPGGKSFYFPQPTGKPVTLPQIPFTPTTEAAE